MYYCPQNVGSIMYHFFVKEQQIEDQFITITGPDVNHIKNVLRMKVGEKILISNGTDCDYLCEISAFSLDAVQAVIVEIEEAGRELPSKIYLFQGIPKADKMELIVQKAVELGVYEIIPVATKRSVVKLDAKKEESKRRRWQAIAESAAKQSKRIVIPNIAPVMSFPEAISYAETFDWKLIPYENASGILHTKELIHKIQPNESIGVFIGAEGGFDEQEIELAVKNACEPITLGKRILRTETAGLTTLSILMFQLEQ